MAIEVKVVPNDPTWVRMYDDESRLILDALGENAVKAFHIGSTAIPTIVAKPLIDMLLAVNDIEVVDACNEKMEDLGYEVMGEYGIATRRFFRKFNAAGERTYHVHVFPIGSPQVDRHLAFRDFMNAHPRWATAYSELKKRLAASHPDSMESYHNGKNDFISQIDELAAAWRRRS